MSHHLKVSTDQEVTLCHTVSQEMSQLANRVHQLEAENYGRSSDRDLNLKRVSHTDVAKLAELEAAGEVRVGPIGLELHWLAEGFTRHRRSRRTARFQLA